MKGAALLVATSLSVIPPMPATAEAAPAGPWPTALVVAGADAASPDTVDSRLMLQLGMLLALVYVGFLCAWLSRTRHNHGLDRSRHRVRASFAALTGSVVSLARAVARRRAAASAGTGTGTPWTCEIVWKRGRVWSRFQAVIVTSDGRKRRVVAESAGLRWPPKDVRNPPTHELEATLGTLVTSLTTTGWEPVPSSGSWSERRFVWRRPGAPPTRLRPGSGSPTGPAGVPRSRRATGSRALKPARGSAASGTDPGGRLASPD
jgi:hypothetical protein